MLLLYLQGSIRCLRERLRRTVVNRVGWGGKWTYGQGPAVPHAESSINHSINQFLIKLDMINMVLLDHMSRLLISFFYRYDPFFFGRSIDRYGMNQNQSPSYNNNTCNPPSFLPMSPSVCMYVCMYVCKAYVTACSILYIHSG